MSNVIQPIADRPVIAPTRKALGVQPLQAARFLRASLRNKQDTHARTRLLECTLPASFYRKAAAFVDSPFGRKLYEQESDLTALLDDRSQWLDCGSGTVAAHYRNFVDRQNTSAKAFKDLSDTWRLADGRHDDRVDWYIERAYSTHDIVHVLFGYDFDQLGETCLLACIAPHYSSLAVSLHLKWAERKIANTEPYKGHTRSVIAEAHRNGRRAPAIWEQDIRALMRMDLAEARARLGIRLPTLYPSEPA